MKAFSYSRFSTAEQSTGDSERRQSEDAKAYAEEHGYALESIGVDRGISAFRGKNIEEGVIGDFIKRVESRKIPAGSVLLLESPDRFSRQLFSTCWPHFQRILSGGVEIHFLFIRRVLKPNHSFVDLLQIGVEIDRGNSESANKSERVGRAWKNKKANASNGLALTAVVPAWLSAIKGQKPVVIPERAAVVRKIFRLAALGMGAYRIAAQLTKDGDAAFGSKGWTLPYIKKVLKSRAVLGEFQPQKRVSGSKANDGEPILDFFPQVITHEEWNAARASVANRTHSISKAGHAVCGGRVGSGTNLFSGLLFDISLNDRPMTFRGKSGRGRYDYVVTAFLPGQKQNAMRYDWLETSVLAFFTAEDWHAVVGEGESIEVQAVHAELEKVLTEKAVIERRLAMGRAAMDDAVDVGALKELADNASKNQAALTTLTEKQTRLYRLLEAERGRCVALADPETLLALISAPSPDSDDIRLRLKAEIQKRVSKIGLIFGTMGIYAEITYANEVVHGVVYDRAAEKMVRFSLNDLAEAMSRCALVKKTQTRA